MTSAKLAKILSISLSIALLASCAGTSPELVLQPPPPAPPPPAKPLATPPPEIQSVVTAAAAPITLRLTPKVDILFVIDTSDSMQVHIDHLYENVNRFVETFQRRLDLDFHIGVVTTWDSQRYGFDKIVSNPPSPLGQLRQPVAAERSTEIPDGVRYVSRESNWPSILASTLKVAIEPRFKTEANGKRVDGGGPEFEDLFSPVRCAVGVMNEPVDPNTKYCAENQNGDFIRPDAHLAVIFLTDADDTSGAEAAQLIKELSDLKKPQQKTVSVYGALAITLDKEKPCKPDYGLIKKDGTYSLPTKLMEAISLTGNEAMSLCDPSYGSRLARIAKQIEERTIDEKFTISLGDQLPQPSTLQVHYDGQPLDAGFGRPWSYDSTANAIQIHGDHEVFKSSPGGQITVQFTPVDWKRVSEGHIRK